MRVAIILKTQRAVQRIAVFGGVQLKHVECACGGIRNQQVHDATREPLATMLGHRVHVKEHARVPMWETGAWRLLDEQKPGAGGNGVVGLVAGGKGVER